MCLNHAEELVAELNLSSSCLLLGDPFPQAYKILANRNKNYVCEGFVNSVPIIASGFGDINYLQMKRFL